MVRRMTDTLKKVMIKMYTDGVPIVTIAKELGMNKTTIHRQLTNLGIKEVSEEDSKNAQKRLTDEQKARIVELYKTGIAVREIAEQLETSGDAVYRQIRKLGLNRKLPVAPYKEAIRLYEQEGLSVDEVLERTGIARATFFRRLKKYHETGDL